MPPSSTNVYGGQHDTQYVTFEQLLLHAALFVADEIRGSMLEPNRNTQVTPPPSGLWVRTTTSYCSKQPGQTGQLVHYNFSTPYIPGTWYLVLYYYTINTILLQDEELARTRDVLDVDGQKERRTHSVQERRRSRSTLTTTYCSRAVCACSMLLVVEPSNVSHQL